MEPETKAEEGVDYFLAIDIESTGPVTSKKDIVFAIGFAFGTSKDILKTGKIIQDLGRLKEKGEEWKDLFERRQFDKETWDTFWSKNMVTLDYLEGKCTRRFVDDKQDDFVDRFDTLLYLIEEGYSGQWTILTNMIPFDPVWLTRILGEHDKRDLFHTRDGKYISDSVCDVDCYIRGLVHSSIRRDDKNVQDLMSDFVSLRGEVEHDPEMDAINILRQFQHAIGKLNISF